MSFLVAHPPLGAGVVTALVVFLFGAYIGNSLGEGSTKPVNWFTPAFVAALAFGVVVAFVVYSGGAKR